VTSLPLKKLAVALAVAASALLSATADASPVRRPHARPHRVAHRALSPAQTFARIATHAPERRVYRHPPSWLKRAPGTPTTPDNDAAIQANVAPASTEVSRHAPSLERMGLLGTVHTQAHSHDGFAQSSPRAPPACG